MGFGHGVYKVQDPRSPIVKAWVEKLAIEDSSKNRFEIAKKLTRLWIKKKIIS